MNNWIINTMPTLITVLQSLGEHEIEIISVDTDTVAGHMRIHCDSTEEFLTWVKDKDAEISDIRITYPDVDSRGFPYEITVMAEEKIEVFCLMSEERYREWRGE